jgi:hypothetical protein
VEAATKWSDMLPVLRGIARGRFCVQSAGFFSLSVDDQRRNFSDRQFQNSSSNKGLTNVVELF